jgi:hypothetical protein
VNGIGTPNKRKIHRYILPLSSPTPICRGVVKLVENTTELTEEVRWIFIMEQERVVSLQG